MNSLEITLPENGGIILSLNLENGCGGKYEQNT